MRATTLARAWVAVEIIKRIGMGAYFKTAVLMVAALTHLVPRTGAAQTAHDLAGTWRLLAVKGMTGTDARDSVPYGPHPTGFLTYTTDGRMSAIISYGARKRLSVTDRVAAPVGERAEAFATFLAYAGRYTVSGDTVIHQVEAASVENWVGTEMVRVAHVRGDRLILEIPPVAVGGRLRSFELTWQRLP